MSMVTLELDDIYQLAHDVMLANGCDRDNAAALADICLLYTSPSPRDGLLSRMPSSA